MKTIVISVAAVALAGLSAPAFAQSLPPISGYGSLGYTGVNPDGHDLGEITGRLGARFGSWLGVEGEVSKGVVDASQSEFGGGGRVHENFAPAVYGVGFVPITSRLDLIGRVGYGESDLEYTAPDQSATSALHSINYGGGVQYFFDGTNGVRGDYTRRDFQGRNTPKDADSWTVSYVRKF